MDPKSALGGPKLISRTGRVASRSHVRVASKSQGQTMGPKFSIFGVFLALLAKTSFTTPHFYPKYELWTIEVFLWWDPFKEELKANFVQLLRGEDSFVNMC